ncbi:MAG: putative maltose transporter MalT [Cytophagales bacterium]|jgi:maltose/moltooligosaccharide transporter|nr:MAG: putative maltose transporter MalT [Cytophagales bacterium]
MDASPRKPRLTIAQIFNMSFGFFGIQFGFALQNGNASRILTTFGANVEHLSWFWLAAPLTGMIVQPLIGYYSDRTWTSLGRRRPYFLAGSILASAALLLMPNAQIMAAILPPLYIGAGILMVMDASFNVAMEPFRALVADLLPSDQRTLGFSVQTCLIGLGAVIGSWLPYILAEYFNASKVGVAGSPIPDNVTYSFYAGAFVFLIAILWTVVTTKEFPPDTEYLKKETEKKHKGLTQIISDFAGMPKTMKQLGLVQFFSWFALFSMWVFSTSAVATHVYGLSPDDHESVAFNDAGNWVGIIFGVYNGVSAIYALLLPAIAAKIGRKRTHSLSLIAGGIGLISIYFIHDYHLLIWSMVGVGMAWASILAMPYAILGGAIPPQKMGIYMGVFNFFITLPQIINGIIGGPIVKYLYGSQAIYSIVMAGVFLLVAAFCVRFVDDVDDPVTAKK